jgi:hypothetical protein
MRSYSYTAIALIALASVQADRVLRNRAVFHVDEKEAQTQLQGVDGPSKELWGREGVHTGRMLKSEGGSSKASKKSKGKKSGESDTKSSEASSSKASRSSEEATGKKGSSGDTISKASGKKASSADKSSKASGKKASSADKSSKASSADKSSKASGKETKSGDASGKKSIKKHRYVDEESLYDMIMGSEDMSMSMSMSY